MIAQMNAMLFWIQIKERKEYPAFLMRHGLGSIQGRLGGVGTVLRKARFKGFLPTNYTRLSANILICVFIFSQRIRALL
jgi:hypothetical protein